LDIINCRFNIIQVYPQEQLLYLHRLFSCGHIEQMILLSLQTMSSIRVLTRVI